MPVFDCLNMFIKRHKYFTNISIFQAGYFIRQSNLASKLEFGSSLPPLPLSIPFCTPALPCIYPVGPWFVFTRTSYQAFGTALYYTLYWSVYRSSAVITGVPGRHLATLPTHTTALHCTALHCTALHCWTALLDCTTPHCNLDLFHLLSNALMGLFTEDFKVTKKIVKVWPLEVLYTKWNFTYK